MVASIFAGRSPAAVWHASRLRLKPQGHANWYRTLARFLNWEQTEYYSKTKAMEVTKALAALKPLYGKGNIEIVTRNGSRVRGIVRSMKTTQALTTPSVKVERGDGQIVKVPFSLIAEIIDHNHGA
jgi:hypothetical protein